MCKGYLLMIVEGDSREKEIINKLDSIFFANNNKVNMKVVSLPAGQNIYMLWNKLKEDDFETDLIELIYEYKDMPGCDKIPRDDIAEIYLFFDYDGHQNNLPKGFSTEIALDEMLSTFDNETEHGKLYISYPMVEALIDCVEVEDECFISCSDIVNYKEICSKKNSKRSPKINIQKLDFNTWQKIIFTFVENISKVLYESKKRLLYKEYRKNVSPSNIYKKQKNFICKGKIFILSAFPEFLLDYFNEKFWNKFKS